MVVLEPEAAGSAERVTESFVRTAAELRADGCHLIRQSLQEYEPGREAFDIVLLNASINHLDEDACIRLDRDVQAQNVYRGLFEKLAAATRPEGTLIAYDCSPRNLFARLGVRNPFVPTVEWYKHQPPERWIELLEASGFDRPVVRWSSFNRLRSPGRLVLGHRVPAYFLTSAFCLTMRRQYQSLTMGAASTS